MAGATEPHMDLADHDAAWWDLGAPEPITAPTSTDWAEVFTPTPVGFYVDGELAGWISNHRPRPDGMPGLVADFVPVPLLWEGDQA